MKEKRELQKEKPGFIQYTTWSYKLCVRGTVLQTANLAQDYWNQMQVEGFPKTTLKLDISLKQRRIQESSVLKIIVLW